MFITIGLFGLTVLYIGMVLLLHYKSPRNCLVGENEDDSLCQSEGVDNTILNWASDFFISFWMFVFALHLSVGVKPNTGVRKTGILTQIFMGGAFAMAGVGNWLYPNSGTDDNHGMLAYWIIRIFFAVFFTTSAVAMAQFTISASQDTNPELKKSFCANDRFLIPCGVLLLLSMSGFLSGSLMCALDPDIRINTVLDDFESTDSKHVCFMVVKVSDVVMNFTYAILWLPVGFLLRATAQEEPKLVLGLPTPIAAIIAMITQWTVGTMLVVLLSWMDLGRPKANEFDAWNAIYGTVLYHWAMLVTLYCFHNLSYGLPLYYEDEDEGPTPLSWEWWVAMVAGTVPEPKEIDSDDEEEMKEVSRKEFFEDKRSKSAKKTATFESEAESVEVDL